MHIYTNLKLGDNQFKFILLSKVEMGGQQATLTFKDILQSEQRCKIVADLGNPVHIISAEGFNNVILTPATNTGCANFTQVVNKLSAQASKETRPSDEVLGKLATNLNVSLEKMNIKELLTVSDMHKLLDAMVLFKNYIEGKEVFELSVSEYNIPLEYREQTLKVIEAVNSNFDSYDLSFLDSEDNKTIFMETPEDEVSLQIPTLDNIKAGIDLPLAKSSYFSPFGVDTKVMSEPYSDYERLLPAGYNISDVVGTPDNSDLPIQPNEEKFYKKLCKLIDFGLAHEEYKASINEYLEGLMVKVASWNWMFTGHFPVSLAEDDVDEFGNSKNENTNANESNVEYPVRKGDIEAQGIFMGEQAERFIQGDVTIVEYVKSSETKNKYSVEEDTEESVLKRRYAKAEAVIKLLRWGNRKPKKLHVADNPRYIDLLTYTPSSFSGSYADLKPIEYSDGSKYANIKLINYKAPVKDTLYAKSNGYNEKLLDTTLGVSCVEQYEGNVYRNIYMSIFDFINILQENPKAFSGIELVDDKIKYTGNYDEDYLEDNAISLMDVLATLKSDVDGINAPYFNNNTKDFYSVFMDKSKIGKNQFILYTLAQNIGDRDLLPLYKGYSFKTIKELGSKISMHNTFIRLSDTDSDALILNTIKELDIDKYLAITELSVVFPLIYKANSALVALRRQGNQITFEDKIREYLKVMITEGYNTNILAETTKKSTVSKTSNELKKLNITGNPSTKVASSIDTNNFYCAMPKSDGSNYFPIVKKVKGSDGKAELKVVGTLCNTEINGVKSYIITSKTYSNVKNKPLSVAKILKFIFRDYVFIAEGKFENTLVRFTSREDMTKLLSEA